MTSPTELRTWTRAEIDTLREELLDDLGLRQVGPPLCRRQLQVLMLMVDGLTAREVAQRLHISFSTAKCYTARLYTALGAHNAPQAVHLAYQAGLLTVPSPEETPR